MPDRAVDLRCLRPVGESHARRARLARAASEGPRGFAPAAHPGRPWQELAPVSQRKGRRAELLGVLVRTVPGRGSATRARPEPALTRGRHGAGRDLSRRLARLAELRAPLPPHLPQPARQRRRLRALLRHRPVARERRDRPSRRHRRDLPWRDQPGVPRPRDRTRGAIVSTSSRRAIAPLAALILAALMLAAGGAAAGVSGAAAE